MLQRQALTFEYLLILFYFLQALLPAKFTFKLKLLGFLVVIVSKYFCEGYRLASLLLLSIQLPLFLPLPTFAALPVASVSIAILQYFPVYKHPKSSGPYDVGYKKLEFPGITYVGVYYPTNETTRDIEYAPSHDSWKRFADIVRLFSEYGGRKTLPDFGFKIGTSFMEYLKIGVNKDAKIVQGFNSKGFPVMVFSHGLSANIHLYSLLLKEWASNGFIVLSVDHEEEIYLASSAATNDLLIRKEQLNARKNSVIAVLDYISDTKNVHSLFDSQDVTLDCSKFFVSGHSFGGATAAEVAGEDKRITGGLILLDPWFEPNNLKSLYTPICKPVLSLRSGTFDSAHGLRERIVKHAEANKKNELCLSGFFKGSNHNTATDMGLLIPRELMFFGMIKLCVM